MSEVNEVTLSELVLSYLGGCPQHQAWIRVPEPLQRSVHIRSSVWEPWLAQGGYPLRSKSFCGPLPTETSAAAIGLLADLPMIGQPRRGRDRCISRKLLSDLAHKANSTSAATDLVRLWVATMMWGSGTSNGRGPWRTAQGLADPDLLAVLDRTFGLVANGKLRDAYSAFKVDGCGESYFTKWLWSASLGAGTATPTPLILDLRVRAVLGIVNRDSLQPRGASGYIKYVDQMSSVASTLNAKKGLHMTAEKLEWLMFERPARRSSGGLDREPCLFEWLRSRGA
jgi:hypothetical protein